MHRPSDSEISVFLQEKGFSEADAEYAAHLSEGNVARALGNGGGREEEQEFGEIFRDMMRKAYVRDATS